MFPFDKALRLSTVPLAFAPNFPSISSLDFLLKGLHSAFRSARWSFGMTAGEPSGWAHSRSAWLRKAAA